MCDRIVRVLSSSGQETLLRVIDDNEVEIEYDRVRDSFYFGYSVENDRLTINFTIETPFQLTRVEKGRLGEEIAQIYQAIIDNAIIMPAENRSYDYQALDFPYRKIDVKFSSPNNYSRRADGPLEWEFGLGSHGRTKDYSQSCDALLCVGRRPDGGVEMFLVPSNSIEARCNCKFTIPVNWQNSQYAIYHIELSRVATELERMLFPAEGGQQNS